MSRLRELLRDYLAMRRALGFKLHSDGTALLSFVGFMEDEQADIIRTDLALIWAKKCTSTRPERWATRLSFVRGFARYCRAFEERTEIPPSKLLPFPARSPSPYFFTNQDIETLLQGALRMPTKNEVINHSLHVLFGLLYVTGMRIGEALALTVDDIDLDDGILTLRSTKFGKTRQVPLHATTIAVLADYRRRREQFLAGRNMKRWFINAQGNRLGYDSVKNAFRRLTATLPDQPGRKRPRLHDLRHHFALSTLIRWYREGQDVERRLPVLSAFLGHVEVRDTYWYLSACPELLGTAKDRLERWWEGVS